MASNPIRQRIRRLREKFGLPDFIPPNILWYLSSYYATIQYSLSSFDVVNGYGWATYKKIKIIRSPNEVVFSWDSFQKETLEKAFEKKLPEICDEAYYKDWLDTRRILYAGA